MEGKIVRLLFEGVYMNADVWLNGQHLGNHPYGYTSFWYDVTEALKFGEENVLAVQVKNEGRNSRWYSGSGIYRHVWLKITDKINIAQWGTAITTPEVGPKSATVDLQTRITNQGNENQNVELVTSILNPDGEEVGRERTPHTITANSDFQYDQQVLISSPVRWSLDDPALYTAVSEVYVEGQLRDQVKTSFGIRTITYDAEEGFKLNGEVIELKGGNVHHGNGPLGARAYDRAEERRVELLKKSGYNTIRCAHNPPSPAFLEACDRLGMLVIDEAFDMWRDGKNAYDYHLYFDQWWERDIKSMVRRDRNHPSVIMWSIGNEIPNGEKPETAEVAHQLAGKVKELDPTRPVTAGMNAISEKKDPYFSALDIVGYNYAKELYKSDHERKPDRVMYGSESYPLEAFEYWRAAKEHPWVIGDFVWTAFDYLGEASIGWRGYLQQSGFYPWNIAFCGDINICGWKRPQSYYRDAFWGSDPNVSIFVKPPTPSFATNPDKKDWSIWNWHDVLADWNWRGHEKRPVTVEVYSSCDEVELFLNGESMGRKATNPENKHLARWEVPYRSGELKAVGMNDGKEAASSKLLTAGDPVDLRMSADRSEINADGQDLSYVTVELVDDRGVRNPKAENLVHFELAGPGTIAAVHNANPVSTESFHKPYRKAWKGRVLVIVKSNRKSPGKIALRATSDGLRTGEIVIQSVE